MDLWCTTGPDGLGDKKIILPMDCRLQSIKMFKCDQNNKENPFVVNEKLIENSKQIKTNTLNQVFNITQMAQLLHQSVEKMENSCNYFIGSKEKMVFIGPVIYEIQPSTYGKLNGNNFVFYDKNAVNDSDKFEPPLDHQIGVTPHRDKDKDSLIFIFKGGVITVKSGSYIVFNLPVVVVRSSGDYFTISGGQYNRLRIKTGVHIVLLIDLGIPIPVIFIRSNKILEEVSAVECQLSIKSTEKESSFERKLNIERITIEDISDDKYIPQYIFDWIHSKGYDLEKGTGRALLGMGESSIVRRGTRITDSTPIAAKIIVNENNELKKRNQSPPQELLIIKKMNHQNIIKIVDTYCLIAELPNQMYRMSSVVIMELSSEENLRKVIEKKGKMSEENAKPVFKQVIEAIVYLHTNQIAHRNIRLDNCLVFDNNIIKLCDFSRAVDLSISNANNGIESLSFKYMPPEFFESPQEVDPFKIDVWMTGYLAYCLLSANFSPFGSISPNDKNTNSSQFQSFKKKQTTDLMTVIKEIPKINENGINLLQQTFKSDPNERISSKKLLKHKWLK